MENISNSVFPLPRTTHIVVSFLAVLHEFEDALADGKSELKELGFEVRPVIFTASRRMLFLLSRLLFLPQEVLYNLREEERESWQ